MHPVEYINDKWYWITWNGNAHAYSSSSDKFVKDPNNRGLGTKAKPYLSQEDSERLASTSKLPESEGESEQGATEPPTRQSEDIPVGNQSDDEELATQVGLKMTTTTVAHARGGGMVTLPIENPMQPPTAVAQQMGDLQGELNPPPSNRPYGRPPGDLPGGGGGGGPPPGDGGGNEDNYDDQPGDDIAGLPNLGIPTAKNLAGSVTTFAGD